MAWKVERWLADVFPGEENLYAAYKDLPPRELEHFPIILVHILS